MGIRTPIQPTVGAFDAALVTFSGFSPIASGDDVYAILITNGSVVTDFDDNQGNTYTLLVSGVDSDGSPVHIYRCFNVTNGPDEWMAAFSSGANFLELAIVTVTGSANAAMQDTTALPQGFGTDSNSPMDTTGAGAFLLGYHKTSDARTLTLKAGLSSFASSVNPTNAFILYSTTDAGAAGTKDFGASWTTDTGWGVVGVAIPASGGGGPVDHPGTGALTAPSATVAGSGHKSAVGSGALTVGAATVSGTGAGAGNGALTVSAPAIAGSANRVSNDMGGAVELVASSPTISGSGTVNTPGTDHVGTGALVASSPSVAGSGFAGANSGALTVSAPVVSGTAVRNSVGTGALVARTPTVRGQSTDVHNPVEGTGVEGSVEGSGVEGDGIEG